MTGAGGISKEKNKKKSAEADFFLFFSLEMPPALLALRARVPVLGAVDRFFFKKTRFFQILLPKTQLLWPRSRGVRFPEFS